jgi:hypothetical protein
MSGSPVRTETVDGGDEGRVIVNCVVSKKRKAVEDPRGYPNVPERYVKNVERASDLLADVTAMATVLTVLQKNAGTMDSDVVGDLLGVLQGVPARAVEQAREMVARLA